LLHPANHAVHSGRLLAGSTNTDYCENCVLSVLFLPAATTAALQARVRLNSCASNFMTAKCTDKKSPAIAGLKDSCYYQLSAWTENVDDL
jgi:hypothetical protein